MILLEIFVWILITDLFTGIMHWLEDTYGNPDSKNKWIIDNIVTPNHEHHKYPRKLLQNSFFNRIKLSFQIALSLGVIFYFLGILCWQTIFFLTYAFLTNEIHSWAHRTEKENGKIITLIQKTGLLQSRRHHGFHHSKPYTSNYCILTNYLNPFLEKMKFWRILEYILAMIGIKPTRDNVNRIDY